MPETLIRFTAKTPSQELAEAALLVFEELETGPEASDLTEIVSLLPESVQAQTIELLTGSVAKADGLPLYERVYAEDMEVKPTKDGGARLVLVVFSAGELEKQSWAVEMKGLLKAMGFSQVSVRATSEWDSG